MYDNIGEKIKTVAIIEAIGFLIAGIVFCTQGLAGLGIALIFGGALFSWISSFVLYGFGQLIVNSDIIASHYYNRQVNRQEKVQERETQRETIKAIKTIKDENVDSSAYIDFSCPICREKISYTKGQITSNKTLSCPMCGETFNTIDAFRK